MVLSQPSSERAEAIVKSLELQPQIGAAYLRAGGGLERLHELRKAVSVLRTAVKLLPQDARAYNRLGVVLYKAATRVEWQVFRDKPGLQMPLQRVPGDELTCWRSAEPDCYEIEHYSPTQLHIAEEDYLRRMENNAGDTRAVLSMGRLLRNCCVTASVQALRLDPRKSTAYLTLAHVLPIGGSLGLYRRALQIEPREPAVYFWYGDALLQLRYYKQANRAYRSVLELEPASMRGYLALAEVRLKVDRPDDAYAMAAVAAAMPVGRSGGGDGGEDEDDDDDDVPLVPGPIGAMSGRNVGEGELGLANALMAEARVAQQHLPDAAELAARAVALAPQGARTYGALGHALYELDATRRFLGGVAARDRSGHRARAIEALQQATSLDPHDTGSRYRLGELLRRDKKRLKEAMHEFQVVLRIDRQHEKELLAQSKQARRVGAACLARPAAELALRTAACARRGQALDEVVEEHREMVNPTRTWKTQVYNLAALVVFLTTLLYFTRHDLRTGMG